MARFSTQAAWRVFNHLKTLNRVSSDESALFKDLFQTALEVALNPTVIFRNFDFDREKDAFWYPSLKKYIRTKMEGIVYDRVREMSGMETYKRTNLGLASRASEKRVLDFYNMLVKPLQNYPSTS